MSLHADGRITRDELIGVTVLQGFRYVLDAFPVVGDSRALLYEEVHSRGRRAIVLADGLLALGETSDVLDVQEEIEARWRLVEHSWGQRARGQDNRVSYEPTTELLIPALRGARRRITHAAPALHGYQGGRCFYCRGGPVSLFSTSAPFHLDHVFPFVAMARGLTANLDDVWNLVVACAPCNGYKGHRSSIAAT